MPKTPPPAMMAQHTPTPDSGVGMVDTDSMSDMLRGTLRVTGTVTSVDGEPVRNASVRSATWNMAAAI